MSSAFLKSLLAIAAFGAAAPVSAATTAATTFDPKLLTTELAGEPTQIMVLGTDHLSQMPPNYRTEFLAPLLDRLAAYKPTVITIEGLSGSDCDYLDRYKAVVPGLADEYCFATDEAHHATGLDVPQAMAEVDRTLAAFPRSPTAAQRRRLAALFLAANDRTSATVQWLRLPLTERHIGDGLNDKLTALLATTAASRNENIAIAATLAARLGLERVYPVDDHSADAITARLGPTYDAAMQRIWGTPSPMAAELSVREKAIRGSDDVLALYRFTNEPAVDRSAIVGDMGVALAQRTPELYGRRYVAWWETRNLRMAANIRAAFGNAPGARVLVIVGSSHKPYFDKYLGMMSDVTIVDTSRWLAAPPTGRP